MTTNGNGTAQHFTKPQQWTLLGLLAAVVLGGGWLQFQHSAAVVDAVKDLGAVQTRSTDVIVAEQKQTRQVMSELVTELKLEAQEARHVHADGTRERDRAVETLKEAIKAIPQAVAERLGVAPRKQ